MADETRKLLKILGVAVKDFEAEFLRGIEHSVKGFLGDLGVPQKDIDAAFTTARNTCNTFNVMPRMTYKVRLDRVARSRYQAQRALPAAPLQTMHQVFEPLRDPTQWVRRRGDKHYLHVLQIERGRVVMQAT